MEIPGIEYLDRTFSNACLRAIRATLLLVGGPAEHALRCWDAASGASEYRMWAARLERDPGGRYVDCRACLPSFETVRLPRVVVFGASPRAPGVRGDL